MNKLRFAAPLLALLLITGCATLPNGRLWRQSATLRPGWDRVEKAVKDAALAPQTWAPLVGAAVFRATDWDRHVSNWALDHHPVFGSSSSADTASDILALSSAGAYGLTVLAAPGGTQPGPWLKAKIRGGLVGTAAFLTVFGTTEGIKAGVHRSRPDRSDDDGFPSFHAAGTTAMATLASRNLEALQLAPAERTAADIGLGGLVAATDWARIEAGKHYPSDVLVGTALGYFVSSVFNDAFLGRYDEMPVGATLDLSRQEVVVGLAGHF